MAKKENTAPVNINDTEYSLNDDRRVRVLSPGMLVAKRFLRNRLAVTGMIILIAMFIFSFIGGLISPYKQDQKFYRTDVQIKDYAGVIFNQEFRYTVADKEVYDGLAQANTVLALQRNETSFESDGTNFTIEKIDDITYTISADGKVVAITSKDVVSSSTSNDYFDFDFTYAALMATANGEKSFECEGKTYTVD